ncbi:MAG: CocE/NonD family hydrolase [Methanobacteriota archaeon]
MRSAAVSAVSVSSLVVSVALAGCLGPSDDLLAPSVKNDALDLVAVPPELRPTAEARGFPAGVHPWPRGDEWPPGLEGPFELLENLHVQIPSHDGVVLDGWILKPALPDGVNPPVVLISGPYWGLDHTPDRPEFWDEDWYGPVKLLVEEGYAVAIMTVRGGGNSGGCVEMFGPNEQKDQAFLVDWLASQDWNNGRVAMMGLSYLGTTPWEAAIQAPPALKTIVVAGMVSDLYTFYHTPQGAAFAGGGVFQTYFNTLVNFLPPVLGATPEAATAAHALVVPERACSETARTMSTLYVGENSDVRDESYWGDRYLLGGFKDVTAAVLLTHGFQDAWGSGHQQQELLAWRSLPATTPKHQLEGQWEHEFPHSKRVEEGEGVPDWNERLVAWYEFWLKGIGTPPASLGTVEYQDGADGWHVSTAWPPVEARSEVLYLGDGTLAPAPTGGAGTFRSLPDVRASEKTFEGTGKPAGALCDPLPGTALVYASEPATERVLVAGDPIAYLKIESDLPGGLVAVGLFDLGPDFACVDGVPKDAHAWTVGAADLRFHEGNRQGKDFPTGTPTFVRFDLTNIAEVLEPGHRLALVVSYGDSSLRQPATKAFPSITVHADATPEDSQLVLPIVEGTLGGSGPALDYPPRPFAPP